MAERVGRVDSANILIVEDDHLLAENLKLHLQQAGHRIAAVVTTGEEAVTRADQGDIDLMVIDIVLSGEIDGIETLQKIQEKHDIPAIFLTAHVSDELLFRAEQARPFAYLLKPYRQLEMEFMINMSLTRAQVERELTAHKQAAEAELLQAQTIIQCTDEGIMLTDKKNFIISVNPAFTRITGYEAIDVIGRPSSFLSSGKHEHAFYSDMWSSILNQGYWQGEIWNRRKNGESYPEWLTINSIYAVDGSLSNYVGIFSDITSVKQSSDEKEQMQRELNQAHKMEALGQLSSGIAHDFNNILGIIMGYLDLSFMRYGDEIPEQMTTYLMTVKQASERAKNLVAQMLTFGSIDTGIEQPLQLSSLLEENIKMLSSIIPSSINIELSYEKDLPMVLMDPTKLQQLVMNLCINAKDAIKNTGTITIQLGWRRGINTECACCHKVPKGEWLELSVADTGCGMTPETLDHMFEPFFTTKEVGMGTGMGMAVLHGIMTSHGGHILIETELGKGSTFRLLFQPMLEKKSGVQKVDLLPDKRPRDIGKQILILDDEPLIAGYISTLLSLHGYKTKIKTDSKEALLLFKEDPDRFDLLITDQTMPGLTGVELIKQLRKIRPELPVIICTGNNNDIDADIAEKMRIKYIDKPIDSKRLTRLIVELFEF